MPIRRTYECEVCQTQFVWWHDSGDEAEPPCPGCAAIMKWRPQLFAIGTHRGKAVDVAQKIIEQDFGVTNFNDRQHEGDAAYKSEPESREKRDMNEQVVQSVQQQLSQLSGQQAEVAQANLGMKQGDFWGGNGRIKIPAAQAMAAAKGAVASDPGANPLTMLHKGIARGDIGEPVKRFRPLARA